MKRISLVVVVIVTVIVPIFTALPAVDPAEDPAETTPTPAPNAEAPGTNDNSGTVLIDGATYADRAAAFLKWDAATIATKSPLYAKPAAIHYAARLVSNRDTAFALSQLDKTLDLLLKNDAATDARLDPFDEHALMHTWLLCRDKMPDPLTAKLRHYMSFWHHDTWRGYGAMNYRLMEDGSAFLAAEQWPDWADIDKLTAAQIREATKKRLLSYFTDMVHHSFPEYEAPTYYGVDLAAMKMIADYAQDPEVKQQSTLTLDWMILNVACSWNQGYNTASCGRAKYWVSSNTSPDEMDSTAGIGWLYFGGNRPVRAAGMNDAASAWFAFPGGYTPPAIFEAIAKDRREPSLYTGSVLLGAKENVRFTVYHTPSYSLASQAEFLSSPSSGLYKETRRSMLKWISDKPSSTFCPLQENPRRPYKLQEHVANAFGYGENPFGQALQFEGTLIGVTDVPTDYPYYKDYAVFSQSGSIVKRVEKQGWVICHAGSMLFAFHPLKPYTWGKPTQGKEVLWSDARVNGWVLETSPLADFSGGGTDAELNRFAAALADKTKITFTERPVPRLQYTSLTGHTLDLTYRPHATKYTDQHQIDGKPIDYAQFPLLNSPWVHQEVNSDTLTLHHGSDSLTYNFASWTRSP